MRSIVLAVAATLVTACGGPRSEFRPTAQAKLEDAPGCIAGQSAAAYPIPDGEVKVAALGVSKVELPDGTEFRRTRALHTRLVVHNRGHEVWTVEVRRQNAFLGTADGDVALPGPIAGDETTLAVVMPNDTRTLDLYYPLPETVHSDAMINRFRIDWRIATPGRVIAARETPFERHQLPPPSKKPAHPKRMAKKPQAQARR
jgi:hypothetical protein